MSDDDLWRPKDSGDRTGDGAESEEPAPAVGDETQPITGSPSTPKPTPPSAAPAAPPGPSSGSPSGPGGVPPAPSPYGQQNPYAQQQNPYGGQPYAPPPNPYPAPNEFATPHNPYGSPYQAAYAGGMVPDHPSATTSMVLGIIGLVGIVLCGGITLVLSPAAWVVGSKAVREIDASPGRYGGRDRAQAGKIMGIIGTVLLVLGVVAIVGLIALAVSVGSSDSTPVVPSPTFQNG